MRSRFPNAGWMGLALAAETGVAAIALAVFGANEHGTIIALQLTGRLSFLLFLPAYAGGAMATLFVRLQPLRQHGREFGLAFASAHLVHLGLVVWLCWIGAAPGIRAFIVFGVAAFWTYLLALLSFSEPQRALGPRGWWFVRLVGMNYIFFAFARDLLKLPGSSGGGVRYIAAYLPFAALAIGAAIAYVMSFLLRSRPASMGAQIWRWRRPAEGRGINPPLPQK
jgi:hypothetical protein